MLISTTSSDLRWTSRSAASPANASGDDVLREMQLAFRRGDRSRLALLLPSARNHPLEPWAAYWELRARLEDAQPEEVQAFLQRWAGTYQEDRLRNDWLRLLGQRRAGRSPAGSVAPA